MQQKSFFRTGLYWRLLLQKPEWSIQISLIQFSIYLARIAELFALTRTTNYAPNDVILHINIRNHLKTYTRKVSMYNIFVFLTSTSEDGLWNDS